MNRDEKLCDEDIEDILANDYLSRNTYLNNFIYLLNTINKNTILALDGKWGSGKTVFVRQLIVADKNKKYRNINSKVLNFFKSKYNIFYYNAWENDSLVPIESILMNLAVDFLSEEKKIANRVIEIVKNITNVTLKIGTNGALGADDLKNFSNEYLDRYIEKSKRILKIHQEIDDIIEEICSINGKRLLLIIDDLDRCNPKFAVELLETIKHNFYNKKIVILICANNEQLQYTIKRYYGEGFDSFGYLDRFYDFIFKLPEPNIDSYLKYYLKVQDISYAYKRVAINIAQYKDMSLRQIKRYFFTLELLSDFLDGRSLTRDGNCGYFVKTVCIPIVLYLKMCDIEKFNDFINGHGGSILQAYSEACPEIKTIFNEFMNDNQNALFYYQQIFDKETIYYSSREAFIKAYSLLGFSSIIDENPHYLEENN